MLFPHYWLLIRVAQLINVSKTFGMTFISCVNENNKTIQSIAYVAYVVRCIRIPTSDRSYCLLKLEKGRLFLRMPFIRMVTWLQQPLQN